MISTKRFPLALLLVAGLAGASAAQSVISDGAASGFHNSRFRHSKSAHNIGTSLSGRPQLALNKFRFLEEYMNKWADGQSGGRVFARKDGLKAELEAYVRYDGDIVTGSDIVSYFGTAERQHSWGWTLDVFPTDPHVTVYIAGVPVSVGGNAGLGLDVKVHGRASVPTASVYGKNTSSTWAYGRGWAMVGVPGFGAGVEVKGDFCKASVVVTMTADLAAPSASGTLFFTPLRVRVRPFLWIAARIYGPTLVNVSSSIHVETLF